MTAQSPQANSSPSMADFLAAIWEPGDVREIRAFDEYDRVHFGYFDSPEKAAFAVAKIEHFVRISITLNPCKPAALARSANKMRPAGKKTSTTSDRDILVLRLILIDIDTGEVAGVSATEPEREAARRLARVLIGEIGKPLIVGDSGNGIHLIYRHNATDPAQLKALLQSLAIRFNSETLRGDSKTPGPVARIDVTTFNPARLTRVLGTWARKGENTPERPHRRSRVIAIYPKDNAIIEVPCGAPVVAEKQTKTVAPETQIDLRTILASRLRDVRENADRTIYILHECLFDPTHTGKDAAIIQGSGGKITYFCFHNSCQGKTWNDAKTVLGIAPRQKTRECRRCGREFIWDNNGNKTEPDNSGPHRCMTAEGIAAEAELRPQDDPPKAPRPPFPIEAFPALYANFCHEIARTRSCSLDYVASAFLVTTSVFAKRAYVTIKPGWTERATIYLALIGDKNSGKTPAITAALAPVFKLEERLQTIRETESAQHQLAMEIYDADLADWKRDRKRGFPNQNPPARPEEPPKRTIYTTDATTEALGGIMAASPSCVLFRDELTAWIKSLDQYRGGKGGDKEFFLSNWSGTPVKVDRRRGDPLIVPHPHLCVIGGIVPTNLSQLGAKDEDGFFERILTVWPDPTPKKWCEDPTPSREPVINAMLDIWDRTPEEYCINLTNEARKLFAIIFEAMGAPQNDASENPKMAQYCARLALLLAIMHGECEINHVRMNDAYALTQFFLAQTQAAREDAKQSDEIRSDHEIVRWAKKRALTDVTVRDLCRNGVRGCPNAEQAHIRMDEMIQLGYALRIDRKTIRIL